MNVSHGFVIHLISKYWGHYALQLFRNNSMKDQLKIGKIKAGFICCYMNFEGKPSNPWTRDVLKTCSELYVLK